MTTLPVRATLRTAVVLLTLFSTEPLRRNDLMNAINKLAGERSVNANRGNVKQLPRPAMTSGYDPVPGDPAVQAFVDLLVEVGRADLVLNDVGVRKGNLLADDLGQALLERS